MKRKFKIQNSKSKIKEVERKKVHHTPPVVKIVKEVKAPEKIEWEAPEFIYHEKDRYWILGVIVMTLGLEILLFYLKDYLFMVLVVIGAVVVYQYGHKEPERKKVLLDSDGVYFRGRKYGWENLKSFWVVEEPMPMVYFEQIGISIHLTILLEDESPSKVRAYLQKYLPEKLYEGEQWSERLNRFFRL